MIGSIYGPQGSKYGVDRNEAVQSVAEKRCIQQRARNSSPLPCRIACRIYTIGPWIRTVAFFFLGGGGGICLYSDIGITRVHHS